MRLHPQWGMLSKLLFFLTWSNLSFIGADKSDDRPPFYWASCNNDSKWSIHDKKLVFDNIFENDIIMLDVYKGEVNKENICKVTFKDKVNSLANVIKY